MSRLLEVSRHARCAACEGTFSLEEWENRHDSEDGLDELHARCCEVQGPCAPF